MRNPFGLGYKAGPAYTIQQLARTILSLDGSPDCEGVPYSAETYAKILDVSTRTVGRALAVLRKAGAVRLLSRGPFPRVLEVLDVAKLCDASDGLPMNEDGDGAKAEPGGEDVSSVEALAEAVRTLADEVLGLRLRLEDSGLLSRQFRRQRRRRGQRRGGARMRSGGKPARGSA